jgi:hypothetical protein
MVTPPARAAWRLATFWAALLLGAGSWLAGCQSPPRAWGPFEQIEIGKPLPADLPAGAVRGQLGVSLLEATNPSQMESTHAEGLAIRILTDDDGRVIAKSQLWASLEVGVFYRWRYRYVFEFEAPQPIRAPAGNWGLRPELGIASTMSSAQCFLESNLAGGGWAADLDHLRNGTNHLLVETRDLAAKVDAVAKKNHARIAALEANAVLEVAVASFAGTLAAYQPDRIRQYMSAGTRADYPLDNTIEQAMFAQTLLNLGPPALRPAKEYDAYLLMKVSARLFSKIAGIFSDRPNLAGLDRPGFQWQSGAVFGPEFTLRNVDGRRIRMELADSFTTATASGDR